MAERERPLATRRSPKSKGGLFVPRTKVMDADAIARSVARIAHEIAERNAGLKDVVIVGLQTGGVWFGNLLVDMLREYEAIDVPFGTLDVAYYRDDYGIRPVLPEATTDIDMDLTDKVVVLVDDVFFTGRTLRAALNAVSEFGRARAIQVAVLVDRGHRELPIRPDYVGKNLPTRRDEQVDVSLAGVVIGDVVEK